MTAGPTDTTILWLHNYWSDAYGIPTPSFAVSLIDAGGATVAEWPLTLEPDATAAIDVRQVCIEHGVALPFEGQALLVLRDEHVVPGRPVQLFAEYVGDDGEASGVHGQFGLMRAPLGQLVGGVRVDPDPEWRSGMVLVNAYDGPGGPANYRPRLEVLAADGGIRRCRLAPLGSRATARVYVDDLVPDLPAFLGGQPGQMRVAVPYAGSRAASFIEARADGRRVVNHATIDRVFDQGLGVAPGWSDSQPVASVLVQVDEHRDTVLTLPNVWGPLAASYPVEVRLHRPDGTALVTHHVTVPAGATRDVSMREVLSGAGVALPVVAHAEVRIGVVPSSTELPAILDLVVGLRDDGVPVGEVQVGGEFFNAEVPPGVAVPDIRRTRVFTRVRTDDARPAPGSTSPTPRRSTRTRPPWPARCSPCSTPAGQRRATTELEIPVHGCVLAELSELFGAEAADVLGPDRLRGPAGPRHRGPPLRLSPRRGGRGPLRHHRPPGRRMTDPHDGGSPPRVSIVLPTLNERAFIRDCLDSLLAQSYPAIDEILVVDGGSTDGTRALAEQHRRAGARGGQPTGDGGRGHERRAWRRRPTT